MKRAILAVLFWTTLACGVATTREPGVITPVPTPSPTVAPSPTPTPSRAPAPRLRRQLVQATQGPARQVLQLIDTRTEQACHSVDTTCLPSAGGRLVHLDPTCADPERIETNGYDHRWVATNDASGARILVRKGDTLRVSISYAEVFSRDPDGSCRALGGGQSSYAIYEIAEVVTDLPVGTIERADVGPTLAATALVADDGSRFVLELLDKTIGARCSFEDTEAGPRCAPERSEITHDDLFDPECRRRAILGWVPQVASVFAPSGASEGVMIFTEAERSPSNEAAIGRQQPDGSCRPDMIPLGRQTLHIGDPYPPSRWPELRSLRLEGPRLVAVVPQLASGGDAAALGAVDARAMFEDKWRQTPCGPVWIDGVLRCAPARPANAPWVVEVFSDAECRVPALWLTAGRAEAEAPRALTIYRSELREGLPVGLVREVGQALEVAYERSFSDGCRVTALEGQAYALGAEIAGSELAELSLALD